MAHTILITGSNRGIGLALTRQLLQRGHRVIATCRDLAGATELQQLAAAGSPLLDLQPLDITCPASVQALAAHLTAKYTALDVLVNNAGVLNDGDNRSILTLDFARLTAAFDINVVGTARITQAVWPLLARGNRPRVVNLASGAGLISTKRNSNFFAYSISKAALNMLTRMLEIEGRKQGICVVGVIPGRVQTRMTNMDAPLTAPEVAANLAVTLENLQLTESGAVLDRHGQPCFTGTFPDGTGQPCPVGW